MQKWRRGYNDRPPPWSEDLLRETVDRRYDSAKREAAVAAVDAGEPSTFPPRSESLRDCNERTLPFLYDELQPAMNDAVARARASADASGSDYEVPVVLVVASENVLRGLVRRHGSNPRTLGPACPPSALC